VYKEIVGKVLTVEKNARGYGSKPSALGARGKLSIEEVKAGGKNHEKKQLRETSQLQRV